MIARLSAQPDMRASVVAVVAHRTLRRKDSISELVNMLPDGQISDLPVQPRLKKYFAFPVGQIISTSSRHPVPRRGAYNDRHERWDGMRWTRQRFARDGIAGRVGERPVSDQQRADERCCSVRRSRVVLTPRCWRQVRGVKSAQPGLDKTYPQATVANKPGHRGEREGNR